MEVLTPTPSNIPESLKEAAVIRAVGVSRDTVSAGVFTELITICQEEAVLEIMHHTFCQ